MGEEPIKPSPDIDVSAPKFVAFIGVVMLFIDAFLYLRAYAAAPTYFGPLFLVTGIIFIAIGVILFLVLNVVNLSFEIPIPYKWWLLVALGGGAIAMALITQLIVLGGIFGTAFIRGGCLVVIGGLVELLVEGDKIKWTGSNLVLAIGAGLGIFLIIMNNLGNWVFMIVGIVLCVLVILAVMDVEIFDEWWILLMVGLAMLFIYTSVAGIIILVGTFLKYD